MKRTLQRGGIAVTGAVVIVLATVAMAFACHNTITGTAVCNTQTGKYDVTWTISNSESGNSEYLSNATRLVDQINNQHIAGGGHLTVHESVSPGAGTLSLSVKGSWPSRNTTTTNSGSVSVPSGGCSIPDSNDATAGVDTTPGTCDAPGSASVTNLTNATLEGSLDTSPGTHTAVFDTVVHHAFSDGSHQESITYTVPDKNPSLCAPPPPPPPSCTACHLPYQQTAAPKVTTCKGILSGGVYGSIYVKPNTDCTIVGGYVNGSIRANGAHSLTLGDVTVRGSIHASHITTNFMFGSTGSTCASDPMVGGSIIAKGSHNVTICNAQVCHKIVVKHADGRVMVRDSRTNRLVVKHNNRFVKDGAPRHKALESVRLFNDKAHVFALGPNKRPLLRRHLVHVAMIGGEKVCTLKR